MSLRLSDGSPSVAETPAQELDRLWADVAMASATITVSRLAPSRRAARLGLDPRLAAADLRAQARVLEARMR
ncbi:MAG: hypothetical protein PGN13_07435 [Patulibacter minatonensis]